MVSSSSESSKRSRLCCLVDGCNSDLSDCREYHRRHRVCENHSKTPTVLVGGKQQRFCQQCSRFHLLEEFDEVKRSCRKRLEGHNRRRRKPKPPSLFMDDGNFLSNYKGPRIQQFGSPQTYASPIIGNMWPVTAKTGAESMSYDQHLLLHKIDQHSHENDSKAGNGNEAMPGTPIFLPISGVIAPPAIGKGSQILSSDGKPGSLDSGSALYLLSTFQTQSSELSLEQSSITSPLQSPSEAVCFDAVDQYSCSEREKDKPTSPVLVRDANRDKLQGLMDWWKMGTH